MDQVVVIGGVAAGLSAASRVRRLNSSARVIVLERGPQASYSACGLPFVLSGRLPTLDSLIVHPPDYFRLERGIDLRLSTVALEIEPARRRVRICSTAPGAAASDEWLPYDRLILATGARPRSPFPPSRRLFRANTWTDVAALDAALRSGEFRRWAVIGGGYIGCEVAEALARRGVAVTLVHAHAWLLNGFDPDLAQTLPQRLETCGVTVRLAQRLTDPLAFADAAVDCSGLAPETSLAAAAGIALGPTGAIAVDDRQQTSVPAIFACGDCAESRSLVSGTPVWIPLATAANRQGRVAGENAAHAASGTRARFPGILASLAVPLAGLEWGRTGLTLAQARAHGFSPASSVVTAPLRAAYLQPDSITLRLVFEPASGRILGCHLRGPAASVAARLDTAATAVAARLTLAQIEHLDCAYAPSLAPLYEPLLIAAHLGANGAQVSPE